MPDNTDFLEHKLWLVKSVEALFELSKEHDKDLTLAKEELISKIVEYDRNQVERCTELNALLQLEVTKRLLLKQDYENQIKTIKKELERKTTITNAIAVAILAGITIVINLITK